VPPVDTVPNRFLCRLSLCSFVSSAACHLSRSSGSCGPSTLLAVADCVLSRLSRSSGSFGHRLSRSSGSYGCWLSRSSGSSSSAFLAVADRAHPDFLAVADRSGVDFLAVADRSTVDFLAVADRSASGTFLAVADRVFVPITLYIYYEGFRELFTRAAQLGVVPIPRRTRRRCASPTFSPSRIVRAPTFSHERIVRHRLRQRRRGLWGTPGLSASSTPTRAQGTGNRTQPPLYCTRQRAVMRTVLPSYPKR
jgi:hypothetical protein